MTYLNEFLPYAVLGCRKTLLFVPSKPRLVPNDLDLSVLLLKLGK